jgi:hypothetical protein
MGAFIEFGIIIAVIAGAAVFLVLRIAKMVGNKSPGCCCGSGSSGKGGKNCPHCTGEVKNL